MKKPRYDEDIDDVRVNKSKRNGHKSEKKRNHRSGDDSGGRVDKGGKRKDYR